MGERERLRDINWCLSSPGLLNRGSNPQPGMCPGQEWNLQWNSHCVQEGTPTNGDAAAGVSAKFLSLESDSQH